MKHEVYKIHEPVYGTHLEILVNCSWDQMNEYVQKICPGGHIEKITRIEGMYVFLENEKEEKTFNLVWLKKFHWNVEDMAMLSHEMAHFVFQMLEDRQVPISKENDESFCYLFGYYMEKAFRALSVHRKKKRA